MGRHIGKTHEQKTEMIPGLSRSTWEQRAELVKPFEVDGWEADSYDMKTMNHHHVRGEAYAMTFRRWVTPSEVAP